MCRRGLAAPGRCSHHRRADHRGKGGLHLRGRLLDGLRKPMQPMAGRRRWGRPPVEDIGLPKDGTSSPGVDRQHSGTLGEVGTCRIGVVSRPRGLRITRSILRCWYGTGPASLLRCSWRRGDAACTAPHTHPAPPTLAAPASTRHRNNAAFATVRAHRGSREPRTPLNRRAGRADAGGPSVLDQADDRDGCDVAGCRNGPCQGEADVDQR